MSKPKTEPPDEATLMRSAEKIVQEMTIMLGDYPSFTKAVASVCNRRRRQGRQPDELARELQRASTWAEDACNQMTASTTTGGPNKAVRKAKEAVRLALEVFLRARMRQTLVRLEGDARARLAQLRMDPEQLLVDWLLKESATEEE